MRIGWFVKRLMKLYFLHLLMRFVIEKPDQVTCIGFEGNLQNFDSWRALRPVEGHPFQLESVVRKIINAQLSLYLKNPVQTRGLTEKYVSHSWDLDVSLVNAFSQTWL